MDSLTKFLTEYIEPDIEQNFRQEINKKWPGMAESLKGINFMGVATPSRRNYVVPHDPNIIYPDYTQQGTGNAAGASGLYNSKISSMLYSLAPKNINNILGHELAHHFIQNDPLWSYISSILPITEKQMSALSRVGYITPRDVEGMAIPLEEEKLDRMAKIPREEILIRSIFNRDPNQDSARTDILAEEEWQKYIVNRFREVLAGNRWVW